MGFYSVSGVNEVLWPAQSPREGFVTFCLDTKSNQKNQERGDASARKAILPARPLFRKGRRFFCLRFAEFASAIRRLSLCP